MARGRKQKGKEKKSEVISFRITEKHKELLEKNPWLKDELKRDILKFLDAFME